MNNPEQQMNIDLSQTAEVSCGECKNDTFTHVFKMRKLSKEKSILKRKYKEDNDE